MMKKFLILLCFLLPFGRSKAQLPVLNFVHGLGNTNASPENIATAVKCDAAGNVFVTGAFGNSVDLDPGAGSVTVTATAAATSDGFLAKYDNAGNFLAGIKFGSDTTDIANDITLDASGNILVTGSFGRSIVFNSGAASSFTLTAAGKWDAFFAKFDPVTLNCTAAFRIGGPDVDNGYAIYSDASGNIFLGGSFRGTSDFNPAGGSPLSSAGGTEDGFFAKYTPAGVFTWATSIGGTAATPDLVTDLIVNSAGEVFICGNFYSTVDFDPSTGTKNFTSAGFDDIFIGKYNGNLLPSNTSFIFDAVALRGANSDQSKAMTFDPSGNIILTGGFQSAAPGTDFDPGAATFNLVTNGNMDVYLAKFTSSLGFINAVNFGGTGGDFGNSITSDATGNIYVTGRFLSASVNFNPAGSAIITRGTSGDSFVGKYTSSLAYSWAFSKKSVTASSALRTVSNGISVYTTDHFFTCGHFGDEVFFDPLSAATSRISSGSRDIFLAKYIPDITLPVDLLVFDAEEQDVKKVKTFWTTSSETNSDFFAVERSQDGKLFEQVGTVKAAGYSITPLSYVFYDEHPYDGTSYYRLRTVSKSASASFSNVVPVYFGESQIDLIFPNPTAGSLRVRISSTEVSDAELQIVDAAGRLVMLRKISLPTGTTEESIDVSSLAGATYFIQLVCNGKEMNQKEFILHH